MSKYSDPDPKTDPLADDDQQMDDGQEIQQQDVTMQDGGSSADS